MFLLTLLLKYLEVMFGVEASLAREILQKMWLEQLYVCSLQSMATNTSEKTENIEGGLRKLIIVMGFLLLG